MPRNPNLAAPMVSRNNFEPFESPASGRQINTRKEREKDLLETGCMPTQDAKVKPQHRIKRDDSR